VSESTAAPPLDRARLERLLARAPLVHEAIVFDRVTSTNDLLRKLAADGAPAGTVVLAEEQTGGRGRMGSRWHSPLGVGLYLSVLFRPSSDPRHLTRWTLGAAVAAAEACRAATGAEIGIRWPNDLLWRGAKLAGALAESRGTTNRATDLVIGLGVNVGQAPRDFPDDLRDSASSLAIACGGRAPAREDLAAGFLTRLAEVAGWIENGRWDEVARRWEGLAPEGVGRRVRVHARECGEAPYCGVTAGLDEAGALRVRRDDGRLVGVRWIESMRPEEA